MGGMIDWRCLGCVEVCVLSLVPKGACGQAPGCRKSRRPPMQCHARAGLPAPLAGLERMQPASPRPGRGHSQIHRIFPKYPEYPAWTRTLNSTCARSFGARLASSRRWKGLMPVSKMYSSTPRDQQSAACSGVGGGWGGGGRCPEGWMRCRGFGQPRSRPHLGFWSRWSGCQQAQHATAAPAHWAHLGAVGPPAQAGVTDQDLRGQVNGRSAKTMGISQQRAF